jgi:hypothetical protein
MQLKYLLLLLTNKIYNTFLFKETRSVANEVESDSEIVGDFNLFFNTVERQTSPEST